jgi:hypothetical protein
LHFAPAAAGLSLPPANQPKASALLAGQHRLAPFYYGTGFGKELEKYNL